MLTNIECLSFVRNPRTVAAVFLMALLPVMAPGPAEGAEFGSGADTVSPPPPGDSSVLARANFLVPISVQQALRISTEVNARPVMLYHSYGSGGEAFVGGFVPPEDASPADIQEAYRVAHEAFLEDLAREAPKRDAAARDELEEHLVVAREAIEEQGVIVIGMDVELDRTQIAPLQQDPLVRDVRLHQGEHEDRQESSPLDGGPEACKASAIAGGADAIMVQQGQRPWWPNHGWITTNESSQPEQRYVWQDFIWTDPQRLVNLIDFSDCPAYESDAVYYNYDDQRYLGRITYWASDYHHTYLDTQRFDDPNEPVYTVGFTNLGTLSVDHLYYTYIRTAYGNANTDKGKVVGQVLGVPWFRAPFCDCGERSPWCYFLDDGEFLLRAWRHTVPGTDRWVH